MLSPLIYVSAGLLWNLEATKSGGITLSFLRADWPRISEVKNLLPILVGALPLILFAAYILVAFVGWHF